MSDRRKATKILKGVIVKPYTELLNVTFRIVVTSYFEQIGV